jgi:hypothetical protein
MVESAALFLPKFLFTRNYDVGKKEKNAQIQQ